MVTFLMPPAYASMSKLVRFRRLDRYTIDRPNNHRVFYLSPKMVLFTALIVSEGLYLLSYVTILTL